MNKFCLYVLPVTAMLLIGDALFAQSNLTTQGKDQTISDLGKIKLSNEPLAKITSSSYYRTYSRSLPVFAVFEPQTAEDIDKLVPQDTYALPWAGIDLKNVLFWKRVWRNISVNEIENTRLSGNTDITANQRLANILLQGFFNGKYKAYTAADDRFANELTQQQMISLIANKQNAQLGSENFGFNPDQVVKFRVKEDWLYLDTQRIWVVRILGIAPVREVTASDGTVTDQPLFWVYYPYIRNYLSEQTVYNSQKNLADYNWDKLFEGRNFSGKIDKVLDKTYHDPAKQ